MRRHDSNRRSGVRRHRRPALVVFLFVWFFVLLPVLIIQSELVRAEYVAVALPFALYGYVIRARRFLLTPQRREHGRRSRLLRVATWGGTAVCVMLLVAYFVGFFRLVEWTSSDGAHHISTHAGSLDYFWGNTKHIAWGGNRGLQSRPMTTMPSAAWWPPVSAISNPKIMLSVRVRIWMIFALLASLTFFGWYLDRRRPARGHRRCRCGYDLTGNVSGRCPECGSGIR